MHVGMLSMQESIAIMRAQDLAWHAGFATSSDAVQHLCNVEGVYGRLEAVSDEVVAGFQKS